VQSLQKLSFVRILACFGILTGCDIAAQLLRAQTAHLGGEHADALVLPTTLLLTGMLVWVYSILVRRHEHRSASELRPGVLAGIGGGALGVALFSCVFAALGLAGVARWRGLAPHFDPMPTLTPALIAAVGEELAFRGVLFRMLEARLGSGISLALSAALFGLLHAFNSGATIMAVTAVAVEAGILLSAAYGVSRNLWFPIGLHFGWNFTEGGIFGVSVSGFPAGQGFFRVELAGPDWLTGGAFGPEASIIAMAVCIPVALLFLALMVRGGRWVHR
jgi:uncharacterized protein